MNREQLKIEIDHILDSGANSIRLMELFDRYKNPPRATERINESDFITFNITGENVFYLDKVLSKFNNNCAIYQNKECFRLDQKDGIRTNIPKVQALQLIDLLKLYPVKCPPLVNAITWRLENIQK